MVHKDPEVRKKYHRERMAGIRKERLRVLRSIKADKGCLHCGERDPIVLTFHHRDPSTKEFTIGSTAVHGGSVAMLTKLVDEARKCDVLCYNCHARVHFHGET